ncbi:30S ribosomal protein S2 [Candidatus Dependentiae bacterium]|nr:30S ribosomal protein S2 [Candidatus Dependentiae bacterium]
MIDFRKLVEHGVHFGHQTSRWNPRMQPYIWGHRNGIHLIDVSKTAFQLEKAAKFLHDVAAEGKTVLLVGTKKAAQGAIENAGKRLGMPFVRSRWVGGTLTNYSQVKKSVTRLLHFEDVLAKSTTDEQSHYTKKELNTYSKITQRLEKGVGGIRSLRMPLGAVIVVDVRKESTAVKEAQFAGVPVVAMVDTNCDPSAIDFVIPANDDAPRAIEFIINFLADAIEEGKKKRAIDVAAKQAEHAAAAAAQEPDETARLLAIVADEEEERKPKAATRGARKAKVGVVEEEGTITKTTVKKPTA